MRQIFFAYLDFVPLNFVGNFVLKIFRTLQNKNE